MLGQPLMSAVRLNPRWNTCLHTNASLLGDGRSCAREIVAATAATLADATDITDLVLQSASNVKIVLDFPFDPEGTRSAKDDVARAGNYVAASGRCRAPSVSSRRARSCSQSAVSTSCWSSCRMISRSLVVVAAQ